MVDRIHHLGFSDVIASITASARKWNDPKLTVLCHRSILPLLHRCRRFPFVLRNGFWHRPDRIPCGWWHDASLPCTVSSFSSVSIKQRIEDVDFINKLNMLSPSRRHSIVWCVREWWCVITIVFCFPMPVPFYKRRCIECEPFLPPPFRTCCPPFPTFVIRCRRIRICPSSCCIPCMQLCLQKMHPVMPARLVHVTQPARLGLSRTPCCCLMSL